MHGRQTVTDSGGVHSQLAHLLSSTVMSDRGEDKCLTQARLIACSAVKAIVQGIGRSGGVSPGKICTLGVLVTLCLDYVWTMFANRIFTSSSLLILPVNSNPEVGTPLEATKLSCLK